MPNSTREYVIVSGLILALLAIWYYNFVEIKSISAPEKVAVTINKTTINSDSLIIARFLENYNYKPQFKGFKSSSPIAPKVEKRQRVESNTPKMPGLEVKGVIGHIVLVKINDGKPQFWKLGEQKQATTLISINPDSIVFRFNNKLFSKPVP